MSRPRGCRLRYQAHAGTSAGTNLLSTQTLLCRIGSLHRAMHICSRCVYTLVLPFKSVCIKRGLNLCCSVFSLTQLWTASALPESVTETATPAREVAWGSIKMALIHSPVPSSLWHVSFQALSLTSVKETQIWIKIRQLWERRKKVFSIATTEH